jgi:Tfp pilus assembly protein PilZ
MKYTTAFYVFLIFFFFLASAAVNAQPAYKLKAGENKVELHLTKEQYQDLLKSRYPVEFRFKGRRRYFKIDFSKLLLNKIKSLDSLNVIKDKAISDARKTALVPYTKAIETNEATLKTAETIYNKSIAPYDSLILASKSNLNKLQSAAKSAKDASLKNPRSTAKKDAYEKATASALEAQGLYKQIVEEQKSIEGVYVAAKTQYAVAMKSALETFENAISAATITAEANWQKSIESTPLAQNVEIDTNSSTLKITLKKNEVLKQIDLADSKHFLRLHSRIYRKFKRFFNQTELFITIKNNGETEADKVNSEISKIDCPTDPLSVLTYEFNSCMDCCDQIKLFGQGDEARAPGDKTKLILYQNDLINVRIKNINRLRYNYSIFYEEKELFMEDELRFKNGLDMLYKQSYDAAQKAIENTGKIESATDVAAGLKRIDDIIDKIPKAEEKKKIKDDLEKVLSDYLVKVENEFAPKVEEQQIAENQLNEINADSKVQNNSGDIQQPLISVGSTKFSSITTTETDSAEKLRLPSTLKAEITTEFKDTLKDWLEGVSLDTISKKLLVKEAVNYLDEIFRLTREVVSTNFEIKQFNTANQNLKSLILGLKAYNCITSNEIEREAVRVYAKKNVKTNDSYEASIKSDILIYSENSPLNIRIKINEVKDRLAILDLSEIKGFDLLNDKLNVAITDLMFLPSEIEYAQMLISIVNLNRMLAGDDEFIFPIQPKAKNIDMVEIRISRNDLQSERTENYSYNFFVREGFKLDFSTGLILHGLNDHRFTTVDQPNSDLKQIVRENTGRMGYSIATILNSTWRSGETVNGGFSFGLGFSTEGQFQGLMGLHCTFGKFKRIILHGGAITGFVDRLAQPYSENLSYSFSSGTVPVTKRMIVSPFFGVSFNITSLTQPNQK